MTWPIKNSSIPQIDSSTSDVSDPDVDCCGTIKDILGQVSKILEAESLEGDNKVSKFIFTCSLVYHRFNENKF